MMNGLFVQLMMFVTAIGLAFFYVKPTLGFIGELQNNILEYQTEKQKVEAVNKTLIEDVALVNSISAESMKRLVTFIPDTVNHVAVIRDIYYIGLEAGFDIADIRYEGVSDQIVSAELTEIKNKPFEHGFVLTAEGTYNNIKRLLQFFENNEYPLDVTSVVFTSAENGELKAEISIVTYALTNPELDKVTNF
jgi:hypothetical protein